jgi:hypothetical protein
MASSTKQLSEAAQRMIDEHRAEQQLDGLLDAAPVFESKAAVKAATPRKPPYTPEALVQLMVDHPEYSHSQFAAAFGYKASWFAGVLVSDRFQKVLDPRRHEVSNPALTGTMQDMFQAVVVQAVVVLQSRLENPQASEDLIIKAITAGTKALGMGTPGALPPPPQQRPSLNDLASRLSVPKIIEATPARDWTIEAALEEIPR